MGPDWLGSPQHALGSAIVALLVAVAAGRTPSPRWVVVLAAAGVGCLAEVAWELIEYAIRYSGHLRQTAYWDTVADLAASLAGAIVGAAVGLALVARSGDRSLPLRR